MASSVVVSLSVLIRFRGASTFSGSIVRVGIVQGDAASGIGRVLRWSEYGSELRCRTWGLDMIPIEQRRARNPSFMHAAIEALDQTRDVGADGFICSEVGANPPTPNTSNYQHSTSLPMKQPYSGDQRSQALMISVAVRISHKYNEPKSERRSSKNASSNQSMAMSCSQRNLYNKELQAIK